jgi:UPF0755 protein
MKLVALILAVVLLLLAGGGAYAYREIHRPHAGFTGEIFLLIEKGTSTRESARLLASNGVISAEWTFMAARALRPSVVLQAGEYRFFEPASVWRIQDRLIAGDVYYYALTIPEGSDIFTTAELIASLDWIDEAEALEQVNSPALIADLDPAAENLEGYLFPSTYHVSRGADAAAICRMMTAEFRRTWQGFDSDADVRRTVILASLVEKETARPAEQPAIASVFHNRLRRGMRLECDPTVIYAAILENRYDGVIHRSDLASPNPYNTYTHDGLPPGPITSPGAGALRATLEPDPSDYIFFVAKPDNSGAHEFSETLAAHNRAVARYRRGIRKANGQKSAERASGSKRAGRNN